MFSEEDWGDNDRAKDLEKSLFSHNGDTTQKGSKCPRFANENKRKNPSVSAEIAGRGSDLSKRKRKRNRSKHKKTDGPPPAQSAQADMVGDGSATGTPKQSNSSIDASAKPKQSRDLRKRRKLMKMMNESSSNKNNAQVDVKPSLVSQSPTAKPKSRSELLRERVSNKLQGSKFRFLNEQLYSCTGAKAKKLFSKDPTAFTAYHDGFSQQVAKWPINPLDKIISYIKKRPPKWVIGDFGCGDARLAATVKNKVYSFDLVACNERVTATDIAHVPIADGCLDVAVFCLSLMGTNFTEFLREANRTLKLKGLLKIAEVSSRFSSISKFVNLLKSLGFELENQEREDSHFYAFDFRKVRSPQAEIKTPESLLKPCVYKRR